ncbi:MAG: TMEM175 family protein [Thermomicrobiales bacterium]|nr:TMEM175 family protein [Thermomicrobiales bacterium]
MSTSRLEAFSDGVLAIIITIMVLELSVPEKHTFAALWDTTGLGLLSYALSFVYVGIYWNNHHHMFQLTEQISGAALWANLHLLFWLSLIPFSTAWMDEGSFTKTPTVVYGVNLLGAAVAYFILQAAIIRYQGRQSTLRNAVGSDTKGRVSPALYIAGIVVAALFGDSTLGIIVAVGFYVIVAILWLIPDQRIEHVIAARADIGDD